DVAIQEVRETLFDLSQQGQFAHMLRFIGPFYGAFEEAVAKWTGLALENPALLARARQIWEAPERMAMQWEDDEGNQYLSLVPEWAQALVPDSLRIVKDISFRKDQLNMILEGPGYSPWVTIPASELVKDKP